MSATTATIEFDRESEAQYMVYAPLAGMQFVIELYERGKSGPHSLVMIRNADDFGITVQNYGDGWPVEGTDRYVGYSDIDKIVVL